MRVLLYNFLFLAIFLALGSIAAEIFLRFDGRYSDLTKENLTNSRAIWDRPSNVTQYQKHPDLDYEVKIVFNDFQVRNHHGISVEDAGDYQGKLVGVFGDSFTENRRINDEFTFTTLLDEILKPDHMVLNFGVDGYGLDQSYLKYLAFRERSRLDHVFYVFFSNDLRNMYETQLFDFSDDGIGELRIPEFNPVINFIRKFHVTYLLLDSYARLKARITNDLDDRENINKIITRKFGSKKANEIKKESKKRFHDSYADSMVVDYLSDTPTEGTLEWANRFRMLLSAWESQTQSHGSTFTILVTPDMVSTSLASKLFGRQFAENTVYLSDALSEGYDNYIFRNDDHWNELGNLRAARAVAEWGKNANYWSYQPETISVLTAQTKAAIKQLYSQ